MALYIEDIDFIAFCIQFVVSGFATKNVRFIEEVCHP